MKNQSLKSALAGLVGLQLTFGLMTANAQQMQNKGIQPKPTGSGTIATTIDLSTPEATIDSFAMALQKGDIKGAISCVSGAKMSPDWQAWMLMAQQDEEKIPFPALGLNSSHKAEIQGDKAIVTQQLECRREGNDWKIIPLTPDRFENAKRPSLLMLATILAHPEVLTIAREQAFYTNCLSNMKQLATAMIMFMQDSDGKFAFNKTIKKQKRNKDNANWSSLRLVIYPYVKSLTAFHCVADADNAVSYSFNMALDNVAETKIAKPAETVLIYEGKNGQLDFKHNGRATVGFVDGHARQVTAEEAKKLRWKP